MFKRSLGILLALVLLLLPVFGLAEITVTGADGAQVTLESAPQRIVALPVWAGEMLLDMVETERIVGLSAWGDDPLISATADKAAQVKARVASSDLESLIALSPDLVVLGHVQRLRRLHDEDAEGRGRERADAFVAHDV